MTSGLKTAIYPVKDLARAKALYGKLLGQAPDFDEAYYVQFNVGDQRVGLDPGSHGKGLIGAVGYWHVDDITASLRELVDAGAEEHEAIRDVGGGTLIASVKDADGSIIGLIQPA